MLIHNAGVQYYFALVFVSTQEEIIDLDSDADFITQPVAAPPSLSPLPSPSSHRGNTRPLSNRYTLYA